ncbi:MAG: BPL-N domain-containing protein [Bilophila wadsworthia]
MTDIAIFWDASQLWGLLVWRAAEAFGLPYRLVKAKEIAQGALSDKTSLLIVPGGTARHKSAALGEKGREAVRAWVRGGGRYVGFCGGAGLGLSDAADPVRTAEIGGPVPVPVAPCGNRRTRAALRFRARPRPFSGRASACPGIFFRTRRPRLRTGYPDLVAGALCGVIRGP